MNKLRKYLQIQKELFKSNKLMMILLYFCKIVSSIILSITTLLTANLITTIVGLIDNSMHYKKFLILIALILICSILKELIGAVISNVILQRIKDKYVKETQLKLFEEVQHMDSLDLNKNILKNKLTDYQRIVKNPIIINDLDTILNTIFGIISQIIVLIAYFKWSIVIVLLFIILYAIFYLILINRTNKREFEIIESTRTLERETIYYNNILFNESVYMENRLYFFKDFLLKRFLKLNAEYSEANNEVSYKYNKIELMFSLMGALLMNAILIIYLYYTTNRDIGIILSIITVLDMMLFYIMDLKYVGTALNRVSKMFEYGTFIKNYIKENFSKVENKCNESDEYINIKDVSFCYDANYVLKNINIKINKGEHVAIVGENGSGKSTLIKILIGIIQPLEGSVSIKNENPYYKLLVEGNSNCALMSQDIVKYKGITLSDNIVFGKNILIDYGELEDNKNSIIGPEYGGVEFSTGQWRQIILKRILYSNKDIIIMDEPDESLDVFKEKKLYEEIEDLFKEKTVIFITHRLNNVKKINRIIYLKNGVIEGDGDFNELIENTSFKNLYNSQSKWYKEEENE